MMASFNPDAYQNRPAPGTNKEPPQRIVINLPQNSQKQLYH